MTGLGSGTNGKGSGITTGAGSGSNDKRLRFFLGRYDKRNADHTNDGCDANQDLGVQTVVTERVDLMICF